MVSSRGSYTTVRVLPLKTSTGSSDTPAKVAPLSEWCLLYFSLVNQLHPSPSGAP